MECILINYYPSSCRNIQSYILDSENLNLRKEFENTNGVEDFIKNNAVDIIFCYVENESEMQELDQLNAKINLDIVIISKQPGLAVNSFDIDALDFILCPFNKERLTQSIKKTKKYMYNSSKESSSELNDINRIKDFIFIKSDRKIIKINFKDIIYIEGMKDYVVVNTKTEGHITAVNLKTFHSRIPNCTFYRVNKSHIINVNYIDMIVNNNIQIHGLSVPIGRTYREIFQNFVSSHLIRR